MTVVRLGDNGLFLHSPVPLTPEIRAGLSDLDFDRVTVTHGEVLETGGKEAFRKAMLWL